MTKPPSLNIALSLAKFMIGNSVATVIKYAVSTSKLKTTTKVVVF